LADIATPHLDAVYAAAKLLDETLAGRRTLPPIGVGAG
jgi:hypothetical protein